MTTSTGTTKFPLWLWISLFLFVAIWFYMLGARTLVPTDEGRYAEMAREMVATGNWITPRLNGIKYFEKPPLQTWMNALTFSVFGLGEWQARLWTGLSALFGIFLVGYTGNRLFGKQVGIGAVLVLASSFWWSAMGHINTLDMGLSGMMTLALCGLLLGQHDQATAREQRNGMLLCWLGMALATLSKGPMGIVLPGAVLVLYTLVSRDWRIWQRLHLIKGLLLYFAITTPWFVLISQANSEFLHFFFIHEHWERFTSKVHHRDGPLYYFIPLLIIGIFPWLGVMLQSLWNGSRRETTTFQPKQLLLIWSLFIFAFFSVSSSKLPSYILPVFPALALLIALYLEAPCSASVFSSRPSSRGISISSALLGLTGLTLLGVRIFANKIPALTAEGVEHLYNQAYLPYLSGTAAIMLCGSLLAFWLIKQKQRAAIWVIAWAGFASSQLLMLGHEPWGRYLAGVEQLPLIQAELRPEMPLFSVGRYEQSLPFYLRHTTILVEHPDELEFGLEQEPQLWLPKRDDFIRTWRDYQARGMAAMAIIQPEIYTDLLKQGVIMRIVTQDPRRVIVSSTPARSGSAELNNNP